MATTRLTKTFSSAGTRTKYTISVWVKRSQLGEALAIMGAGTSSNNYDVISFDSSDHLYWHGYSNNGANFDYNLITTRKFRDTSGWLHIVCAFDSTQGTSSNRQKIYINGVQETAFSTETYSSVNYAGYFFNNIAHGIGTDIGNGTKYFNGLMSHFHGVDGTAYAASTFGSTDSTTGEWKINTSPSITMGTNGFTILKDGNTITDQSSNSNDFTLGGGTLTKTEDSPSNVFNVWNRNFLTRHHNESTSVPGMLQNGNTTFNSTANAFFGYKAGTLGATSGKWYWECKIIDNGRFYAGICMPNVVQGINTPWYDSTTYSAIATNYNGAVTGRFVSGSTYDEYASGNSLPNNTIVGFALDMDNQAFYIHKNGTYFASGDPTSGSSRTGSVIEQTGFQSNVRANYLGSGEFVSPFVGDPSSSGTHHSEFNFGNGYFGTSAVSSAGTNASGIGIFEYDVPSGYTALSTKGLNL